MIGPERMSPGRNAAGDESQMEVDLYVVHGVRSAPHFLEGFRTVLHRRLEEAGHAVRSETLFPYGDWNRSPAAQLREAARDLFLAERDARRSVGGRRVLERIREGGWPSEGHRIVLAGHSAGGVAAARAAELMMLEGASAPPLVVMIGSPRFRISAPLREWTLRVCAGAPGRRGVFRPRDGIVRIAAFGGLAWPSRTRSRTEETVFVPIVGGHTDYFRDREPWTDAGGRTNLELTLDAVRSWLTARGL